MGERWILAVDLGTGGVKTGAVSLRGQVLVHAIGHLNTRYLPDGGAVQDPAEWWCRIVDGVRSVIESKAVVAGDLVAVGLTGQWGSTVPVDPEGRPAGDCLLWAATRGGRCSAKAVGGPVPRSACRRGACSATCRLRRGRSSASRAFPWCAA